KINGFNLGIGAHHGLAPERKSGAQHQVVLGSFEGGVYGALTICLTAMTIMIFSRRIYTYQIW
ncbi:hypothetical protein, partial [Pseudomonas gessardii]